jgi:hypothetical protein
MKSDSAVETAKIAGALPSCIEQGGQIQHIAVRSSVLLATARNLNVPYLRKHGIITAAFRFFSNSFIIAGSAM